ncbi:MAG: phage tail protein, partial [Synergistales bacterium]|nr:phage tail protein [Synergistales bacterium]
MPEQFLHGVEIVEIEDGTRPIRTVRSAVIGLIGTAPEANPDVFPVNKPVLIAGSLKEAAKLGTKGTLPMGIDGIFDQTGALVIVVRVNEGVNETETMANIIGGVNAATGQFEGVHALLGAESKTGYQPRIICAPGFTHQRYEDSDTPGTFLANPVVAELQGIADRLRAVVIADGPNTTDEAAFSYAGDFGTARIYVVDPFVTVFKGGAYVDEPSSARVAGIIAKSDAERGFWWSPSNNPIYGIVGTARPVDFSLGDPNARANLLNEKNVTTIIRQDGYRLWGNRTLSSDPKWAFLCVRRTADIIHDSLQRAHLWAVDRNLTKTYFEAVVEGVNAYLRHLTAVG